MYFMVDLSGEEENNLLVNGGFLPRWFRSFFSVLPTLFVACYSTWRARCGDWVGRVGIWGWASCGKIAKKRQNNERRKVYMQTHLYLSLSPEALIASNLSPKEFGAYFATGSLRRNYSQAIFFELDKKFKSDYLPVGRLEELCKPHADGSPHKSVYLSVYRVLEHVPFSAVGNLYVVTSDGKSLKLSRGEFVPDRKIHPYMYQTLAPSRTRVVSILNPAQYACEITASDRLVRFDKIAFCDMKLGELEDDVYNGDISVLPYANQYHMRDCLIQVSQKGGKNSKVLLRTTSEFPYRMIRSGFFIGGGGEMLFYPMPSVKELENEHYDWWRSASLK